MEGVERVAATLGRLARDPRGETVSVSVGYTQNYALHVHEDMQAVHPVGQAKFLEQPAREGQQKIASIVRRAVKSGLSMLQGLLMAGLWLQRQSQLMVPVDTGSLRNSAFTREDQ